MKKKLIRCLPVFLLCCALLCSGVTAALEGFLHIRVENEKDIPQKGFVVYAVCVADAEGVLVPEFAGANISAETMLNPTANASNAKVLYAYAMKNGIKGTETVTDENGEVQYIKMGRSVYLVWAGEQNELSFTPFLVYMPTMVNDEEIWGVESVPKAGEKPKPTPTPEITPAPPPPPSIPQTGINKLPMHLLLIFGTMFIIFGATLLICGKGRRKDE